MILLFKEGQKPGGKSSPLGLFSFCITGDVDAILMRF